MRTPNLLSGVSRRGWADCSIIGISSDRQGLESCLIQILHRMDPSRPVASTHTDGAIVDLEGPFTSRSAFQATRGRKFWCVCFNIITGLFICLLWIHLLLVTVLWSYNGYTKNDTYLICTMGLVWTYANTRHTTLTGVMDISHTSQSFVLL